MTLDELYQKVNYFAGKDKRGRTMKVTEFNTLLPTVQDALYSRELDRLVVGDIQDVPQSRLSITPLRPFIQTTAGSVVLGKYNLPSTYRRWILISVAGRPLDVVTQTEYNRRSTSPFRRPAVRPFCYVVRSAIYVSDADVTDLDLQYFANPTTPYYDYCQDADTLNEIYMPVGSYIALNDDNTPTLYNSEGVEMFTPVTKDGVSTYPYTSRTTELQWEAIYHDKFVTEMLAAVGINLQQADLTQYATAKGQ